MRRTFGAQLDAHNGIGPGFDFARIALAFAVLGWHSPLAATGSYGPAMNTPAWVLNFAVLPMFFGLSGFLVAGSAQRLSLANFAINRGLRIFPALIVEILLSAFLLGPILTTVNLSEYFTSREFFTYLENVFGLIHYRLPGVFLSNPIKGIVNGSLWTVPFEILCYVVMAGLIVTGFVKRGWMLVGVACAIIGASMVLEALAYMLPQVGSLRNILSFYQHNGKGPALLPCFVLGAAVYVMRYRIPYSLSILGVSALTLFAFGALAESSVWSFTPVTLLTAPAFIYIVCFVGLTPIPRVPYFWRGDYSYGIYLYGFPIQQTLVVLIPSLRNSVAMHFLFSAVLTTLFATFSWHMIEKPILQMRKKFSFVARREREREAMAETGEPATPPAIGAPR